MNRRPTREDDFLELRAGDDGPVDLPSLFGLSADHRFELEIGFGKGKFLLAAAQAAPETCFLGVEHAKSLLHLVLGRAERAGLSNIRLSLGDARALVARIRPAGILSRVHLYCPDPWPKRRHAAKRIFNSEAFVEDLLAALAPGGELVASSDHDPYFRELSAVLASHPGWVSCLAEDIHSRLPKGGFDAIFETDGIPVFRGVWEKLVSVSEPSEAGS